MDSYLTVVSGENLSLSQAELESLVKMVDSSARVKWRGTIGIVDASRDPCDIILRRAVLVKECGRIVADGQTIDDSLRVEPEDVVSSNETFCVRCLAPSDYEQKKRMETDAGARVEKWTGARVSLKSPDVRLVLFKLEDRTVLCKSVVSDARLRAIARGSRRKPFFHPSMMNAPLAGVLCNLAQITSNDVVLDPFCGGGGIVCEAAIIGATTVGIDLNWKLVQGAVSNLEQFGGNNSCVVLGDARSLPIDHFDCVVSDPPYGRVSSTRGAQSVDLVRSMLNQAVEMASSGARFCICGAREMNVSQVMNELGLDVVRSVSIRVHRSLTRDIVVARH
ncbi:MAG: methyltransferase domain-containing protein [Candidatus Thorarchaeota archaeon]|nr:methyltransferase domain-containing protein [Candidatus Thorarchaeota archaeon]